ncbi:MAG: tetratricopeptide repeat protein [Acidobacteriota bacterium]
MVLPAARSGARAADVLILAALGALATTTALAPLTSNDVWLHLATGKWILSTGQVPRTEVFSFVAAGRPYIAHEWGSELLLACLHRLGGLPALMGFKVFMATLLAWGCYLMARWRRAAPALAGSLAGLFAFTAGAHLWVRPHLFTWAAALATVALLSASRRNRLWLGILFPLQVAWTNFHGGFILGPLLILAWALGEALRRWTRKPDAWPGRVALAGLAAALACLINPYGWKLVRLPFELTGSAVFMQAVYEWQSPFFSRYSTTTMFAGFLLLVILWLAGLARAGRRIDPCDLLVCAVAFLLAARMNRNVPLFMLLAAPFVAGMWAQPRWRIQPRLRRAFVPITLLLLLGASILLATAGYPYGRHRWRPRGTGTGPRVPEAACQYVETNKLTGHAFTTYENGAYVAWRLWPQVQIGMDSRNSVYGERLYLQYRQALESGAGLSTYMRRWPLDLAIVSHRGPFHRGPDRSSRRDFDLPHRGFLQSGRMVLVDFDDRSTVYVSNRPENAALIARDGFRLIHPVLLPAIFPEEDLSGAAQEAERAVERHPEALVTHWILANVYAQQRRADDALLQLHAMQGLERSTPYIWGVQGAMQAARLGLTGLLNLDRGDCPEARRALEEALRIAPAYRPARDLLGRLDC